MTITPPAPIEDEALGMSQRWFTPRLFETTLLERR